MIADDVKISITKHSAHYQCNEINDQESITLLYEVFRTTEYFNKIQKFILMMIEILSKRI
jgi:hypothetical protein